MSLVPARTAEYPDSPQFHNGTFDPAFHDWDEPLERVVASAQARGAASTPLIGQAVDAASPPAIERWWRTPADADRLAPGTVSAASAEGMPR